MCGMDNYHLTYKGLWWQLKKQGEEKFILTALTKEDALDKSVKYMKEHHQTRPGSLKIHKEDGTFQEERTYPRSADPSRSPG